MKMLENMIKLKYQKIMKKCSYSPKIGHFAYDFRVFSYVFLMFFDNKNYERNYKIL